MLPQHLHPEIQEVSQTNMPNTKFLTFPQTIFSHSFICLRNGNAILSVAQPKTSVSSLLSVALAMSNPPAKPYSSTFRAGLEGLL